MESVNPNTDSLPDALGALSAATATAFYGKLATPAAPQLEWFNVDVDAATGYAELRFPAIIAPDGSEPAYYYQLFDVADSTASSPLGGDHLIDLAAAGSGSPYVVTLYPNAARIYARVYVATALGASATSDPSDDSPVETMGEGWSWGECVNGACRR